MSGENAPGHRITYMGIKYAVNERIWQSGDYEVTEVKVRERQTLFGNLTRCYCCRELDQGTFTSKRNMLTGNIIPENHLSTRGKAVKKKYDEERNKDIDTYKENASKQIDTKYQSENVQRSHIQRNEGIAETGHQQANVGVMRAQTQQHKTVAEAGGYDRFEGVLNPKGTETKVLVTTGGGVTGMQPVQQTTVVPTPVQQTTIVQPTPVQSPTQVQYYPNPPSASAPVAEKSAAPY